MHKTLKHFISQLGGILLLNFSFCLLSTSYATDTTKPAQRIISLLPSLTETVCALGACNRLVGIDRYSNWPESIAKLPRMGGGIDPNIESIVALKPDLVLMAGSARGIERLKSLGLTVLTLEPKNYADVQLALGVVGKALGVPSKDSDRVWRDINAQVEEISKSVPQYAKAQRVYFEVSPVPFGAGENSFIGETLQKLGAKNILPAAMGLFPQVSPEFVVRAQPDIIMVGDSNLSDMQARPGWTNLSAIRTGRVCTFTSKESDVLVRPGPRMVEASRLMSKCLVEKSAAQAKQRS
jgi:iron complex transport system substrate-binding protein